MDAVMKASVDGWQKCFDKLSKIFRPKATVFDQPWKPLPLFFRQHPQRQLYR
jgi:hypothetical protein